MVTPPTKIRNRDTANAQRVEQALEHIEHGIRYGQYLPGHRLVEVDLAENSGLGIGPIREALRILAGEGLIEIQPYRGARVTRLTVEQIAKVYEAAKGVVYMSLLLAADACKDPKNQKKIKAAFDEIKASSNRGLTEFLVSLAEYHYRIHEVVENPYLTVELKRLHLELVHREIVSLHPDFDRTAIVKSYSDTTRALIAGNFERAKDIQFRHLDRYISTVKNSVLASSQSSETVA